MGRFGGRELGFASDLDVMFVHEPRPGADETLAGRQAFNRFHPTLCTTSLTYGPLEDDGRCLVTLIADHRVLDGAAVAQALERLEETLGTAVAAELRALRNPAAAPREAAA